MVLRLLLSSCVLSFGLLSFGPFGFADESSADSHKNKSAPQRKAVEFGGAVKVTYGSPSWNVDSKRIDSAFVVLRDRASGKLVQIQLEETEPDSSQFEGQFSVKLNDQDKVSPEIYVPPVELRSDNKASLSKLYESIKKGELPRKPTIWKRDSHGQNVLDIYDTRQQAEAALAAYQEEQRLAHEIRKSKPLKPMSQSDSVAAAQAAERKAQLDKLALEATQREQERIRMEQIERQKAEERARKEREMTEAQKAERRAKALALNSEGQELYNKGEFVAAEEKFKAAVDMDPEKKDSIYKYAVALYHNKKYNDALVMLKLATVSPELQTEKEYYFGLTYYRLAELNNALKSFNDVAKKNDPEMGPSALFYGGVIQYTLEKYDEAKRDFEKVIDVSKDPRLDQQAEEYLDRIAAALAYQKMRENRWTFTGVLGLMYDSNVLLEPTDNQGSGTPTNSPDMRLLTVADLQYRPIFNEFYELTPHFTANLTNSEKTSSAKADPFMYTLAVPFSIKGTLAKHANKVTATPGYDLLYMDPTGTGTKSEELASYYLTLDDTMVMNKNWISIYTVEFRNETSYDPTEIGINSLTGKKYTLRTVQTLFIDPSRKQALMPSAGFQRDVTAGNQKDYIRYDLGLTYLRPAFWSTLWTVGLNYYNMNYQFSSSPKRTDNDYMLTTGLTKPIRDWVTWGLTGSYTDNGSTSTAYGYNKFTILTTATFVTNF